MKELTKALKREARELNDLAYRRELSAELEKLFEGFTVWKKGDKDIFELVDSIHAFHNGPARDLYKAHVMLSDSRSAVAYALAAGTIKESEVSKELRIFLEPLTEFYRKELEENGTET
jgi:hypothetical protein